MSSDSTQVSNMSSGVTTAKGKGLFKDWVKKVLAHGGLSTLEDMHDELFGAQGSKITRELDGKDVVIVMGPSGAGKRSLLNGVINGAGSLTADEDGVLLSTTPIMCGDR